MNDIRRDHFRLRRSPPRKRVRGQSTWLAELLTEPWSSDTAWGSDRTLHRPCRTGFHRHCRSSDRPAVTARIPSMQTREASATALREGIDAVAGAVDFVRSLPAGLAQGGRVIELDALDPHTSRSPRPSRSCSSRTSTAAGSMSSAASQRPISTFMPPTSSASRSTAPQLSKIQRSARPAHLHRARP